MVTALQQQQQPTGDGGGGVQLALASYEKKEWHAVVGEGSGGEFFAVFRVFMVGLLSSRIRSATGLCDSSAGNWAAADQERRTNRAGFILCRQGRA